MRRLRELLSGYLRGALVLFGALVAVVVLAAAGGGSSDDGPAAVATSAVSIVPTTDLPKPVILEAVPTPAGSRAVTPGPPTMPIDLGPPPVPVPDLGGLFGDGVLSYPTVSTDGWKTYTNERWGYSFKYPPGWALDTLESVPPDY